MPKKIYLSSIKLEQGLFLYQWLSIVSANEIRDESYLFVFQHAYKFIGEKRYIVAYITLFFPVFYNFALTNRVFLNLSDPFIHNPHDCLTERHIRFRTTDRFSFQKVSPNEKDAVPPFFALVQKFAIWGIICSCLHWWKSGAKRLC